MERRTKPLPTRNNRVRSARPRAVRIGARDAKLSALPTVLADQPPEATEGAVTQIWRCTLQDGISDPQDTLAREEPLEIRIQGRSIAVTMRTPGHDREL